MATTQIPVYIPLGMAEQFKALMESNYDLSIERDGWHLSVKETEEEDWGEEGVDWEWEYYDEEEEAEAEPKSVVETVNAEAREEEEVKEKTKKKRKTSAYQCFCSGSINMMRKSSPELLESLEKSNGLWKHLGAEWQKIKLNVSAFQVYQDQADIINGISSESDSEPEGHVEVEKVLSHHQVAGKPKGRYKIKFVGFKKPEWVDGEDCACDELIQEYWNR